MGKGYPCSCLIFFILEKLFISDVMIIDDLSVVMVDRCWKYICIIIKKYTNIQQYFLNYDLAINIRQWKIIWAYLYINNQIDVKYFVWQHNSLSCLYFRKKKNYHITWKDLDTSGLLPILNHKHWLLAANFWTLLFCYF